jgi:hypothetical protein
MQIGKKCIQYLLVNTVLKNMKSIQKHLPKASIYNILAKSFAKSVFIAFV